MYKIPNLDQFKSFFADTSWLRKAGTFSLLTGEGALDLGVNLIVMVMVERSLGEAGLGIFAYLLSIYVLVGFVSEFGICRYLEGAIAIDARDADQAIAKAL
jgi:O-antigen/teichoic acid export membrane protein